MASHLESHISSNLSQVLRYSSFIVGFATFPKNLATLANVTVEIRVVSLQVMQ